MKIPGAALALTALLTTAAQAEVSTLFTGGDWAVQYADEGKPTCYASTRSNATLLAIVGSYQTSVDGRGITLTLLNESWNLGSRRPVAGSADVGYDNYSFDGTADGTTMTLWNVYFDFIQRLQSGVAVAFKNDEGRTVETFSLRGSRAAIEAWSACILRLPASTTNPFGSSGEASF